MFLPGEVKLQIDWIDRRARRIPHSERAS